jgi:hypothetical protein
MTDTHVISALKTEFVEIASQIEDSRENMRLAPYRSCKFDTRAVRTGAV